MENKKQRKLSSFICRTEILKSFQFFATLASFLRFLFKENVSRKRFTRTFMAMKNAAVFMNEFHVYSFRSMPSELIQNETKFSFGKI